MTNIITRLLAELPMVLFGSPKLPHSEAKEQVIYNVNFLGGSSRVPGLLETIGNSAQLCHQYYQTKKLSINEQFWFSNISCIKYFLNLICKL